MAITEEPRIELERAKVVTPVEALGVFSRPMGDTGWRSWITTVDHKRIGLLYGGTALFFFLVGGVEALLIRLQLARPNGTVLSASTYNELFTMHGTTMVFLVRHADGSGVLELPDPAADRRRATSRSRA